MTIKQHHEVHNTRLQIAQKVRAEMVARMQARLQVIAEVIPLSKPFEVKWLVDERRSLQRQLRELDGLD